MTTRTRANKNSRTEVLGVTYLPGRGQFRGRGYHRGRHVHIGYFQTLEEAEAAMNRWRLSVGRRPVYRTEETYR